ncbi:MAG TPA: ATP-binding cassette domain-containing protein, partial [Enterovirga sp.]|nr:ATP-binding cassette domain-containing protein [Enterovirga sp.]
MSALLQIAGLQAAYGPAKVLFDISFAVGAGEVVTLLGRNGMGKTTTIRSIMGLIRPATGAISFEGRAITGRRPDLIARQGLGL